MTTATAIFLFVLIFLSLALMTMGYIFRRPAMALAAGIAWLIFGLYSYSLSAATWDIYYGLFWLGLGMLFVCLLEGFILRPKEEQQEPQEDYWRDEFWVNEKANYFKRREELRKEMALMRGNGELPSRNGRGFKPPIVSDDVTGDKF